MARKEYITKGFVLSWTETHVTCLMIISDGYTEKREFEFDPYFKGMRLFKGKNIWMGMTIEPGTATGRMNESNQKWLTQKMNYWLYKDFKIPEGHQSFSRG